MEWISEGTALPTVGATVLLLVPRPAGEYWDMYIAWLAVDDEEVVPHPVAPGTRWPTTFWWNISKHRCDPILVTGNAWWSTLDALPLPPGAAHHHGPRGEHCIAQPALVWVGQHVSR